MPEDELEHERRLRDRQREMLAEEDDEEIDERRYLDAEQSKGRLP